jgi:F-type H+-transporting ATPase subunit b
MLAFFTTFILLFAETAHKAEGGFTRFYNEYFNIPGFELWKFLNLGIFIAIMIYLLKKPLGQAFRVKRDAIRAELIRAEEEKQAALAKLTTAESKLAQLETEKETILANAKEEAAAEKKRLADQTKLDAERLSQQAEADLSRLVAQQRVELRRFSAEESIRLAELKLRAVIDDKKDAKLVKASIAEIGGLN